MTVYLLLGYFSTDFDFYDVREMLMPDVLIKLSCAVNRDETKEAVSQWFIGMKNTFRGRAGEEAEFGIAQMNIVPPVQSLENDVNGSNSRMTENTPCKKWLSGHTHRHTRSSLCVGMNTNRLNNAPIRVFTPLIKPQIKTQGEIAHNTLIWAQKSSAECRNAQGVFRKV